MPTWASRCGDPAQHNINPRSPHDHERRQRSPRRSAGRILHARLRRCRKERGADLVSGGTDTHLALVDLRPIGVTGKDADEALERAGITCNKNGVPNDPLPPVKTSGIRVGSPAGTTRGFGVAEFRDIADMIADVLDGLKANGHEGNGAVEAEVNGRVRALCARFPIYIES